MFKKFAKKFLASVLAASMIFSNCSVGTMQAQAQETQKTQSTYFVDVDDADKTTLGEGDKIQYSENGVYKAMNELATTDKIKVACVGDSLTDGFCSTNGNKSDTAYPAYLQGLLGSKYSVRNFGKTSMTLMKNTNKSYWNTTEFSDSLVFEPDIVIIMLGSNDSKTWDEAAYREDAIALVNEYKALKTNPRIIFAISPQCFVTGGTDITAEKMQFVVEVQRALVVENGWETVDMYEKTVDRKDLYHSDLLHFTDGGYYFAAQCMYEGITGEILPDASDNSRDIPVDVLRVTAGDSQNGEGPERVLDGDNATLWHTAWYGTSRENHWIQFELEEEYQVDGLRYQPRQNGSNGKITKYEILVSSDGEEWSSVTTGEWSKDTIWKTVQFEGLNVKYIRLVAKEAHSDNTYVFASAAEIRLTGEVVDVPVEPNPPAVEEDEVARVYGTTRYETGYAVADVLKEVLGVEKFEAVVVATGKNFADALAGSYLAVEKNAPILLTNGKADNVAQLHAYIKENVAEGAKVYILGGEGAVPTEVDAIEGYEVVRLFGDSRYDTNLAILAEAGITGDSIIVATGKTFADSLSASAAKLPILLVKPNAALNDAQKEILAGMKNIYIVGGEGAVSAAYAEELAAYGEVTRVFGDSRYDTSVEIAKTFCTDAEKAVVASGKNFPDGLCGGPLTAALNAPLVLTKDGGAAAAAGYVADNAIASGYVLGGDGALTDDTVVEVFGLESAEEIVLK